jgi:hypothetical protein
LADIDLVWMCGIKLIVNPLIANDPSPVNASRR